MFKQNKAYLFLKKAISCFIITSYVASFVVTPSTVRAETINSPAYVLPSVGAAYQLTPVFHPPLLKGVTVFPAKPFHFEFILDPGEGQLSTSEIRQESEKLVKYFLASLTVPEKEMWVNLSPYEKDRIIPQSFGQTEMGRDLLLQDYFLKQLTASLMHPEKSFGKDFWERVYRKANAQFDMNEMGVEALNKIWIVPNKAVVFEHGASAFVVDSHLKVMLEEDLKAMEKMKGEDIGWSTTETTNTTANNELLTNMIREVLVPEIEKEVNEGKTFANLRQIYHAMILAVWYKKKLREGLLGQIYVDQEKTEGIAVEDKEVALKIYDQYLEAFKRGAYDYIKEDYDVTTQEVVSRKYFSGGFLGAQELPALQQTVSLANFAMLSPTHQQQYAKSIPANTQTIIVDLDPVSNAMLSKLPNPDVLARSVARSPTKERQSWSAIRRPRMNLPPKTVSNSDGKVLIQEGVTKINMTVPDQTSDDVRLAVQVQQLGLDLLKEYSNQDIVQESVSGLTNEPSVEFVENYEAFVGIENGKFMVDIGIPKALGFRLEQGELQNGDYQFNLLGRGYTLEAKTVREGMQLLSALNQLYNLYRLQGMDSRKALLKLVQFYEIVAKKNPSQVDALHKVLRTNVIDSDNLFSFFLKKATGPARNFRKHDDVKQRKSFRETAINWFKSLYTAATGREFVEGELTLPDSLPSVGRSIDELEAEDQANWKEQMVVWFLSKRQMDAPIDLETIDAVLASDQSGDSQATDLLKAFKAYDSANELLNATRQMRKLREQGQALSSSRFGRASYFLMMLAATSQFVVTTQHVEEKAQRLQKVLETEIPSADISDELRRSINTQINGLKSDLIRIREIIDPNKPAPSKAEVKGRVLQLQAHLQDALQILLTQINKDHKASVKTKTTLTTLVTSLAGQMFNDVTELVDILETMEGERANFSVLIQRASPTGVQALSHIMMGDDPFRGGEDQIAEVLRQGGDMSYGSRDDVWFEVSDFWIEALPLFIHEEKIQAEDGQEFTQVVIEQDSMELALRKLAPRFKANINDVMDTEHAELARVIIAQNDSRFKDVFKQFNRDNPKATDEEAALETLRRAIEAEEAQGKDELRQTIAEVTVLVEKTWRNLNTAVADVQERDGVLRYEALKKVLFTDQGEGNLVDQLIEEMLGLPNAAANVQPMIARLERSSQNPTGAIFNVSAKVNDLLKRDIPYAKRREIPTWIILTTQAPGMSDAFAGHWVDEEMGISNITEGFQYNGKSLGDEARELASKYEERVVQLAERLIAEFQLSYRIDELIASGEARDRRSAVLMILTRTKELAEEVSKVYMLFEATLVPQGKTEHDYKAEPVKVQEHFAANTGTLRLAAIRQLILDDPELYAKRALKDNLDSNNLAEVFANEVNSNDYQSEINRYMWTIARNEVINEIKKFDENLHDEIIWYSTFTSSTALTPLLNSRLKSLKAETAARQEVISNYVIEPDGSIVKTTDKYSNQAVPLITLLNDPLYGYAATGRNKKYNRGYGPSRVDLGTWERWSVEILAQWIGPADRFAAERMAFFYRLYNLNVKTFDDVRKAEAQKPWENALMESTLAVTHLFMPLIQAIGVGNMMELLHETNQRPEVFNRPGGAGSSGFCQTKDIYWPGLVAEATRDVILKYAGVSINNWQTIHEIRRAIYEAVNNVNMPNTEKSKVVRETVKKKIALFLGDENATDEEADNTVRQVMGGSFLLKSGSYVPAVNDIEAFGRIGFGDPQADSNKFLSTLIGGYHSSVIKDLESRMRFAPINVIHLLQQEFARLHEETQGRTPEWSNSVVSLPVEYKPVSDPRFSYGLRMLELLAGEGKEHLMLTFGPDGEPLAELILYGFNRKNKELEEFLTRKAYQQGYSEKEIPGLLDKIAALWPEKKGPADIRTYSPFRLSAAARNNYIGGAQLEKTFAEVRRLLLPYMDDKIMEAHVLTYGPDLSKWDALKDLKQKNPKAYNQLIAAIGRKIYVFVDLVRVNNRSYYSTTGSDLWEAHRASDVFATIVHYPEMTGSEDESNEPGSFGQRERIIDNLPRLIQTMRDGRSNSAAIWLDAPGQGRMPATDLIARKQWYALGGTVVNGMLNPTEVANEKKQVNDEINLMRKLVDALKGHRFEEAENIYKQFVALAQGENGRYQQAHQVAEEARKASQWYRGAGFNNFSSRHVLYEQGWRNVANGISLGDLDTGTLGVMGLMYLLNGEENFKITDEIKEIQSALAVYRQTSGYAPTQSTGAQPMEASQAAETLYLFVKPTYHAEVGTETLLKGESSSLKQAEDDIGRAAGRARENQRAMKIAKMKRERVAGYTAAKTSVSEIAVVDNLIEEATTVLGSATEVISNENFGKFMALTEAAIIRLIENSSLDKTKKSQLRSSLQAFINNGRDPNADNWKAFMLKKHALGVLALAAKGDKQVLKQLIQVGSLMDTIYAILLTNEYQQMSDVEVDRDGLGFVSAKVNEAVATFFSDSVYDHTFDYFPSWMHPSKVDTGFTDYDDIFGDWLGVGKPLTRAELLQLAAENHRWLDGYFNHLFRTKTFLKQKVNDPGFVESVLGARDEHGKIIAPIGVDTDAYENAELEWWTYTQKREIAFLTQQGHQIAGVFNNIDPVNDLHVDRRTTVAFTTGIGRPHLSIFARQLPFYNQENPDHQVNLIFSRAYRFQDVVINGKTERVMVIPNGFMYFDRETYVNVRIKQLMNEQGVDEQRAKFLANQEATQALERNPHGIPVLIRASIVNHLSAPFHGAPYYQEGLDEQIGMPTTQAWSANLFGYSKIIAQWIYENGTVPYAEETQWLRKYQYENNDITKARLPEEVVLDRLINGYEKFPGLKNIAWFSGIAKPSRQSGGRGITQMKIRKADGTLDENAVTEFARGVMQQGYIDDISLQRYLSSSPYVWASEEFLTKVRAGLIAKGIALPAGAPLTAYSRVITTYNDNDPQKPEYVLELVVSSRLAVSNVGQGGVLLKWQERFADAEAAKKMMEGRATVARESMDLIEEFSTLLFDKIMLTREEYIQKRSAALGTQEAESQAAAEYDQLHQSFPEFQAMRERLAVARTQDGIPTDMTGWPYARPRYIMNDMIDVPIVKIDEGEPIVAPDILEVKLKEDGSLDYFVIIDRREEGKWKQVKVTSANVVGFQAIKIEDNIGYGLWQPYVLSAVEQERQAALAEKRPYNQANVGRELRKLLKSFTDTAEAYRNTLGGQPESIEALPAPVFSATPTRESSATSTSDAETSSLMTAVDQARERLQITRQFTNDQISVILQQLAFNHVIETNGGKEAIRRAYHSNPNRYSQRIRQQAIAFLRTQQGALRDNLPKLSSNIQAVTIDKLLDSDQYLDAVAANVLNDVFTESGQKPIEISTQVWTPQQAVQVMGGKQNHVLIFGSVAGLADEMSHLITAVTTHEIEEPNTNMLAVLPGWIDPNTGLIKKAIIYDREREVLRLIELAEPLFANRVQVMSLANEEVITHQRLSRLFAAQGIEQVNANIVDEQSNPLSAAAIVDDKLATTQTLKYYVDDIPSMIAIAPNAVSQSYIGDLRRFILGLMDQQQKDEIRIRVKPRSGTEGEGQSVILVTRAQVESLRVSDPLIQSITRALENSSSGVVISQEVGNVRYQMSDRSRRRMTVRLNVTHSYPGQYSVDSGYVQVGAAGKEVASVSQGGIIMSFDEVFGNENNLPVVQQGIALSPLKLQAADIEKMKETANRALEGVNLGLSPRNQLYYGGVDIELEVDQEGKLHFVVLEVNARPTGLRHAQADKMLFPQNETTVPSYSNLWANQVAEQDIPDLLIKIVQDHLFESHAALYEIIKTDDVYEEAIRRLRDYIAQTHGTESDPKLLLKQEHAIIMLADLFWHIKVNQKGKIRDQWKEGAAKIFSTNAETQGRILSILNDEKVILEPEGYLRFIDPFLKAANEREIIDFRQAIQKLTRDIKKPEPGTLRFVNAQAENAVHVSHGPMRFGISSANASDGWMFSKLVGGVVLNAAINIDGKEPLRVEVGKAQGEEIVLEIIGGLEGDPKRVVLTRNNIADFLKYKDSNDPFRMLKYALQFTGIVSSTDNPNQIMDDVIKFTGGKGLHIRVTSFGPSRSGFASSSAVSVNLLHALYMASGQSQFIENKTLLGSLALLFENELGLKSGRQDVDGPIFQGIKEIRYNPTTGFVAPEQDDIRTLDLSSDQIADMQQRLIFVNSGIPRTHATDVRRGLNQRHLAYLSRNKRLGFPAVLKSLIIHQKIVEDFETQNWPALGQHFLEYMSLREQIDPGATWSKFDSIAGGKVLRKIFDPLVEQGLIYGGMFTGAMGGGVAMIVATDKGLEQTFDGRTRIQAALAQLKISTLGDEARTRPYAKMRVLNIGINGSGSVYEAINEPMASFETAVEAYNREMEGADNAALAAIEQNLSEVKVTSAEAEYGGIFLGSNLLDMQVKRDGIGLPLPINQQPLLQMNIGGFTPIIVDIVPTSLPQPFILGLVNGQENLEAGIDEIEPTAQVNDVEKISYFANTY